MKKQHTLMVLLVLVALAWCGLAPVRAQEGEQPAAAAGEEAAADWDEGFAPVERLEPVAEAPEEGVVSAPTGDVAPVQTEQPVAAPGEEMAPLVGETLPEDLLAPEEAQPAVTAAEPVAAPPPADEGPAVLLPEGVEDTAATELIELRPEEAAVPGDVMDRGPAAENLISVTLDNVPLQDVMRMFARISGANIVSGTNLQGNITVSLKDVEWQPALRTILDTAGMTLVMKSPGIYSVVSKSEAASAPVTMDTIYLRYTTVTNVLPIVQRMLISSNASVAGVVSANAIVVQETSERLDSIKDVIIKIDKPRPQVFIEAKFVELNDSAVKNLGINWSMLDGSNHGLTPTWQWGEERERVSSRLDEQDQADSRRNVDTLNREYDADGQAVGDGTGRTVEDAIERSKDNRLTLSESFIKTATELRGAVLSADQLKLTLSALKSQGGASVVSNPRIVVASGETARIHVGRKDPNYVTVDSSAAGGDVKTTRELSGDLPFIETGVLVDVRAIVNTESNITLKIQPTLSRILTARSGAQLGDIPPISTRTVISEFNLESGRTVAIGGLTQTEDRENITKVPLLGDIPILGKFFFRHTNTEKIQSEVIIFVTVGLAKAEDINTNTGIPTDGRLIHRHLAAEAGRGLKGGGK